MNQLLRLVDSVYRVETDGDGDRIAGGDDLAERWKQHIGAIAKLEVSWDGRKNCYTFKDGSMLPLVQKKHYRREIWKLDGLEGDAQVILERRNSRRVEVIYEWSGKTGTKLKPATVRVIAKESGKRLAELRPSSIGATAGDVSFSVQQHSVELEEGRRSSDRTHGRRGVKAQPYIQAMRLKRSGRKGTPIFRTLVASLSEGLLRSKMRKARRPRAPTAVRRHRSASAAYFAYIAVRNGYLSPFVPSFAIMRAQSSV